MRQDKRQKVTTWLLELSELKESWLDGDGKAPDRKILAKLRENILEFYPENLLEPQIYPTPEGNVIFEWNAESSSSTEFELQLTEQDIEYGRDVPIDIPVSFHAFAKGENGRRV